MSQHSQRTQQGPTTGVIWTVGVMVVASAAGTGYVFSGPGFSGRELVGCLLGAVLTGYLTAQTLNLTAERAVARDRLAREAERSQGWMAAYTGRPEPEPAPYVDRAPISGPMYPEPDPVDEAVDATRKYDLGALGQRYGYPVPEEVITGHAPQPPETWAEPEYRDEPLAYEPDPERPWMAFEPGYEDRVAVPLPPRVPVSPGRMSLDWRDSDTEVIDRVRDQDETQVIPAQS